MGNKQSNESKIERAFEEIDTSGDKRINTQELNDFLQSEKSNEILSKFSAEERNEFIIDIMKIGKSNF